MSKALMVLMIVCGAGFLSAQIETKFFILATSEACQGDPPFRLSGKLPEDGLLPEGGIYEVANCLKPDCNYDAIFRDSLTNSYYFDPSVNEDSYQISYTVREGPLATVYTAQLDIQAANSQIVTDADAICTNSSLLIQANPPGGRLSGDGLDSLVVDEDAVYFFNPIDLQSDSSYRIEYSYHLTAASGLVCQDSSFLDIEVRDSLQMELISDSQESCAHEEVFFGVNINSARTDSMLLIWYDPSFEPISDQPVFTTDTITQSGTYYVYGLDNNGCDKLLAYEVTIIAPPSLECPVASQSSCHGESNAIAELTLSHEEEVTIIWPDGQDSRMREDLAAGSYVVSVSNVHGCLTLCEVNITEPPPLSVTPTGDVTPPLCHGSATAVLRTEVQGGTAPYRLSLDNITFQSEFVFKDLPSGDHIIYVVDDLGCEAQRFIRVPETAKDSCALNVTREISCHGREDGRLELSATADLDSAVLSWASGDDPLTQNGLSEGTYTITVTSAAGCSAICSASLTAPPPLSIDEISLHNPTCHGEASGVIMETATGGNEGYTYAINNEAPKSVGLHEGLSADVYMITVRDHKGCEVDTLITLHDPEEITAVLSKSDPSCAHEASGSLSLTELSQEVDILWSTGDTLTQLTDLSAGPYAVSLTNDDACEVQMDTLLSEPPVLTIAEVHTLDNDCSGAESGEISLSISGGTGPYGLLWSDGHTDASRTELPAGLYTVTISDYQGCTLVESFTIKEPEVITASLAMTAPSCHDAKDGSLTLLSTPDLLDLDILWSTGEVTDHIDVGQGHYSVTVSSSEDCFLVMDTLVPAPTPLSLTTTESHDPRCHDAADGTYSYGVTGGTPPYVHDWSDGHTSQNRQDLSAGLYSLTITDSNGCRIEEAILMEAPDPFMISAEQVPPSCHDKADGEIRLSANAPIHSLHWADGSTQLRRNNLATGQYHVTVSTEQGCLDSLGLTLTAPEPLALSATGPFMLDCQGDSTGTIDLVPVGGTLPHTFSWRDGDVGQQRSALAAGVHSVTVSDAQGCSLDTSFTMSEPDSFSIHLDPVSSCLDVPLLLSVMVSGRDFASLEYSWSMNSAEGLILDDLLETSGDQVLFSTLGLPPSEYFVSCMAVDANGCTATLTQVIELVSCYDLALRKTIQGPELKDIDEPFLFDIDVFNQGSIMAYDLEITDIADPDLIFVPTKNTSSATGNPYDWSLSAESFTTKIDSLAPGDSIRLSIYFELQPDTDTTLFTNKAFLSSYASLYSSSPVDQDDLLSDNPMEKDDDISDDSNGTEDNPHDDDKCDSAYGRICPTMDHSLSIGQCHSINPQLFEDSALLGALDPDGDGDGDRSDGDAGNLIHSFHLSKLAALGDTDPIQLMTTGESTVHARLETSSGCVFAIELSVEVHPLPESPTLEEEIFALLGDTVTLTVTPRPGYAYQWQVRKELSFQDIPLAQSHSIQIPVDAIDQNNDTYRVSVTEIHSDIACTQLSSMTQLILPYNPPACKNKLNVSLDRNCDLRLTPDQLTTGRVYPDEMYEISYHDAQGNLITGDWGAHIGEAVTFTIKNLQLGASCWGSLCLFDTHPPDISCPDRIVMSCTAEINADLFVHSDNCGSSEVVIHRSLPEPYCRDNGGSHLASRQRVQLYLRDPEGQLEEVCDTEVILVAPRIESLLYPADTLLTQADWQMDENGYPSPASTGTVSAVEGKPLPMDTLVHPCQIDLTYEDNVMETEEYTLVNRTWIVTELCTGTVTMTPQLIRLDESALRSLQLRANGIRSKDIDLSTDRLKLAPNPFSSSLNLDFSLSEAQVVEVEVYALSGVRIYIERMPLSSGRQKVHLDLSEVSEAEGVYMVRVSGPTFRSSALVVKQ